MPAGLRRWLKLNIMEIETIDPVLCGMEDVGHNVKEVVTLPAGLTKWLHVNQHKIKRNNKTGVRDPVLTVKTYKSNTYGHAARVHGFSTITYSHDRPLKCGARVWVKTTAMVEVYIYGNKRNRNR